MKILSLHVDYINFKPLRKAIKSIAPLSEAEKIPRNIKDALAILTAVEKSDSNVEKVVSELVKNVKEIAKSVNAKNIVLYPYAHLSSDLASPEVAIKVLEKAEKELKKVKGFNVTKAPFGYYKELELKIKGHPLAELSREIKIEGKKKDEESIDLPMLQKKLTKIKMSAPKGKKGLKSNVELGRDLDLYIVSEVVGQGLPLLTPKGTTIKREIERFITDEELKRGYLHTSTPIMAKSDLYKISGHWQHYRDSMFVMNVGKEEFALRPMTCPFHFVLYKRKPRSYKDLLLKYAEIATLFRNEKSGELRGLQRVRQFSFSDAHIICTRDQVEKQFTEVLELIKFAMEKLGIKDTWYRFSKWDPKNKKGKYVDNPKEWDRSQKLMKKIIDKLKLKYIEAEDEAAYYGPKLDIQTKDVYGKEDTLMTIQIDFALPEKFQLTYKDENDQNKMAMVIHRGSISSTERIIAQILETTQGNLKLWMSPIQVKVLPLSVKNNKKAREVMEKLQEAKIRVEIDERNLSMSKKVRDAQVEKLNYMVTIGDKEEKGNTIAVRSREGKVQFNVKLNDFIGNLKKEIEERI